MKYAIIGCGFIFPRHKQAIEATGGKIILTCDIDPSVKSHIRDWVALFHHPRFNEVDAVVICTPNYLHSVISREALLRGKKVLCEKPLSIDGFDGLEGVNTVLQLRESAEVNRIKAKNPVKVELDLTMLRKLDYFEGWKGNVYMSGGLLYNLGIHYFDLMIYLLGDTKRIISTDNQILGYDKHWEEDSISEIEFENGKGKLSIRLVQDDGLYPDLKPSRKMKVTYEDGAQEEIELSNKENLSYEDLHIEVYKKFIKGEGIELGEAKKSLQLVHDLLNFKNEN